jgi:hypothetical protein
LSTRFRGWRRDVVTPLMMCVNFPATHVMHISLHSMPCNTCDTSCPLFHGEFHAIASMLWVIFLVFITDPLSWRPLEGLSINSSWRIVRAVFSMITILGVIACVLGKICGGGDFLCVGQDLCRVFFQ